MRFWLCATSVLWENHGADTCITWGLSWGACALSASRRGLCRVSGFLAGSSFFVYAYHGMPLALAIKVVVRYLPPGSELEVIGLYLGSACVVIGIGLALYGGMRRCVPSFLLLITGGR